MVSHHPVKFDSPRHCSNGYMVFFVVGGQDSTCPCLSLKHKTCYACKYEISGVDNNLLVCPM